MEILLATNNINKIQEFNIIAAQIGVNFVSPKKKKKKYSLSPNIPDPVEDGSTYKENADIKALEFLKWSGIPSLADDSGLEVEALDGWPGLKSARIANNSEERIRLVLKRMEQQSNRAAKFVSFLSLAIKDDNEQIKIINGFGSNSGEITTEPQGLNGFGYDPIFFLPEKKCTFAELSKEELLEIGFRSVAVKGLINEINSLILN